MTVKMLPGEDRGAGCSASNGIQYLWRVFLNLGYSIDLGLSIGLIQAHIN